MDDTTYKTTFDGEGVFPYPHSEMLKSELHSLLTEGLDNEPIEVDLGLIRRILWHLSTPPISTEGER